MASSAVVPVLNVAYKEENTGETSSDEEDVFTGRIKRKSRVRSRAVAQPHATHAPEGMCPVEHYKSLQRSISMTFDNPLFDHDSSSEAENQCEETMQVGPRLNICARSVMGVA